MLGSEQQIRQRVVLADAQHTQRVTARVVCDAVGVVGADVGEAEFFGEEFGELPDAGE